MTDLIVIGGGAAGMAAAIAAAGCGDRVLVLERMDRIGKKLLATGNGRCNLLNSGEARYHGSRLAESVMNRMGYAAQVRFWQAMGLSLREETEGRVYPSSAQASTVLDVLRFQMDRFHVRVRTGEAVQGIRRGKTGLEVVTKAGVETAPHVLISCGGCAQPKLGSDGSGYALLRALGHTIVSPRPALTQVETELRPIRGLEGIRVRGRARVFRDGQVLQEEKGEILFASYGVSGICVMQCSAACIPGKTVLSLDLTDGLGLTEDAFLEELMRRSRTGYTLETLLTGLYVPRLQQALLRMAGLKPEPRPADGRACRQLAQAAADFRLNVTGIHGFENAQVTRGGAATEEWSLDTLESLKVPGLYAAGEVLDVDGDCGGYNLMFAFGSGLMAGLRGRKVFWEG